MKKELEKEIRIYKKNEETLYDMFALDEYSKIASSAKCNVVTLTAIVLFEKLVKDFSDEEVTIPFSFQKNKEELLDILNKEYYKIYKKYKDIDECEQLLNEFKEAFHKERICDHSNDNFNFVRVMSRFGGQFIIEFLLSDITMNKKIDLFFELISICPGGIIQILKYYNLKCSEFKSYDLDFSRISNDKLEEQMEKFIEALKPYTKKLFTILSNSEPKYIPQLQDKCFDFNSILFKDEKSEKLVSSVVQYYLNYTDIEGVEKLYESESYLLLSKDVRENNDEMLINTMFLEFNRHRDLLKLISYHNFEVTEDKIKQIADGLLKYFYVYHDKAHDQYEIEFNKRTINERAEDIKNCIIRKASSKNEFKKYKEYSDLFMQLVSNGIETYINNKKDELAKSRKHLYRVLLKTQKKVKEEYKNNYEIKDNDKANKKLLMALTVDELVDEKD